MQIAHEGGIFITRRLPDKSPEAVALLAANRKLLVGFELHNGVSHTEFIIGKTGVIFLETSARVGGAYIVNVVEAATGVNLWHEWVKLELAGDGGAYKAPKPSRHARWHCIVPVASGEAGPVRLQRRGDRHEDTEGSSCRCDCPISRLRTRRCVARFLRVTLQRRLSGDDAGARSAGRMTVVAEIQADELLKHTLERVWSPQLRNSRNVDVYLPASYSVRRRYPVVYMQDGQNLSDPSIAFAGTWDLDAALERLAGRDVEPIIVGVHNTDNRLSEYSPFKHPRHGGGQGDRYLAFLADTLKPRIDRLFRTRRARAFTAIAGSSMGGLISFYGWLRLPETFGHAVAMSPSFWFGRDRLFDYVEARKLPTRPALPGRRHGGRRGSAARRAPHARVVAPEGNSSRGLFVLSGSRRPASRGRMGASR